MLNELLTIKKINYWKNGKGAFIYFDERPETFYIFGNKALEVGQKCSVTTTAIDFGDLKDSHRIESIEPFSPMQKTLSPDSAIVQSQKSTGGILNTPVAVKKDTAEKANEFLMHELIAKQSERIIALENRIENLERDNKAHFARENILQNHCKVSFI